MLRLIGFYDYTVILTYLSLVSAVVGMILTARGNLGAAVLCLAAAGICDAFDGIVARSKKNRTADEKSFGIQIDSLCDLVSFGVFPAVWCYHSGVDGVVGAVCMAVYVLCAVIRLAFFNVMEEKRQQAESGCNKTYRGLPVTTAAIIFPLAYGLSFLVKENVFAVLLHVALAVTGFLFVLDFSVKKPDWQRILAGK